MITRARFEESKNQTNNSIARCIITVNTAMCKTNWLVSKSFHIKKCRAGTCTSSKVYSQVPRKREKCGSMESLARAILPGYEAIKFLQRKTTKNFHVRRGEAGHEVAPRVKSKEIWRPEQSEPLERLSLERARKTKARAKWRLRGIGQCSYASMPLWRKGERKGEPRHFVPSLYVS